MANDLTPEQIQAQRDRIQNRIQFLQSQGRNILPGLRNRFSILNQQLGIEQGTPSVNIKPIVNRPVGTPIRPTPIRYPFNPTPTQAREALERLRPEEIPLMPSLEEQLAGQIALQSFGANPFLATIGSQRFIGGYPGIQGVSDLRMQNFLHGPNSLQNRAPNIEGQNKLQNILYASGQ